MPRRATPYTRVQLQALADVRALVDLHELDAIDLMEIQRELQRDRLIAREQAATQARQLIAYWSIEASELRGAERAVRHQAPKPIKYQHPLTGDTWDGDGAQPDWLRKALLQEGYRVEEVTPGTPAYAQLAQAKPADA